MFPQNGIVEGKHCHIIETAHSLLLSTSFPSEFLDEAIRKIVHVINRIMPFVTSGLSPFEALYGYDPDYSYLKVFDSTFLFFFHKLNVVNCVFFL